jgi:hypothetical protein
MTNLCNMFCPEDLKIEMAKLKKATRSNKNGISSHRVGKTEKDEEEQEQEEEEEEKEEEEEEVEEG